MLFVGSRLTRPFSTWLSGRGEEDVMLSSERKRKKNAIRLERPLREEGAMVCLDSE